MKQKHDRQPFPYAVLAALLLALGLSGCDNQMNFSPTAPSFGDIEPTVGQVKVLEISGDLIATHDALLRATILFDGQELNGARTRCEVESGCAQLHLEGTAAAAAGRHTITFKVLRQSVEVEEYVASASVRISQPRIQFLAPAVLVLEPANGDLRSGEGLDFEFQLQD